MAKKSSSTKSPRASASGFSDEERSAMKARVREVRVRPGGEKLDGAEAVRRAIAAMQPSDRKMAERVDAIVRAHAPGLTPRTWYGMPAYSQNEQVVCFFRPAEKFKTRYATLGFSDEAKLDDGRMWPTDFALTALDAAEEQRIVALVKRAVA